MADPRLLAIELRLDALSGFSVRPFFGARNRGVLSADASGW